MGNRESLWKASEMKREKASKKEVMRVKKDKDGQDERESEEIYAAA